MAFWFTCSFVHSFSNTYFSLLWIRYWGIQFWLCSYGAFHPWLSPSNQYLYSLNSVRNAGSWAYLAEATTVGTVIMGYYRLHTKVLGGFRGPMKNVLYLKKILQFTKNKLQNPLYSLACRNWTSPFLTVLDPIGLPTSISISSGHSGPNVDALGSKVPQESDGCLSYQSLMPLWLYSLDSLWLTPRSLGYLLIPLLICRENALFEYFWSLWQWLLKQTSKVAYN